LYLVEDEYNYHDATRKFIKKFSALGNKVKRFCVIKKCFYHQLITEGLLIIPKHDSSCIQAIVICK